MINILNHLESARRQLKSMPPDMLSTSDIRDAIYKIDSAIDIATKYAGDLPILHSEIENRIIVNRKHLEYVYDRPYMTNRWNGVTVDNRQCIRIEDNGYVSVRVNNKLVFEGKPDYECGPGSPSLDEQVFNFINENSYGKILIQ